MSIGKTSVKSAIVATSIFNILMLSEVGFSKETFFILLISFVVLFCISLVAISITVYPFYSLHESKDISKKKLFNTYFPYYVMLLFLVLFTPYINEDNIDKSGLLFSITPFITAMSAWVWLFLEETTQS